jgi:ABC-type lipoprotein export system ATPase subunit
MEMAAIMVTHDSHVSSHTETMLLLKDGKITNKKQGIRLTKKFYGQTKQNEQENVKTQEGL